MTIVVRVADFSPFSGAYPAAFAEGAVEISHAGGVSWLSLPEGQACAPASPAFPLPTAWQRGLSGHAPPPSVDVTPYEKDFGPGWTLRAQKVGDALLVDHSRGARDVRSISWLRVDQPASRRVARIRDRLDRGVRVESLGPVALLIDAKASRFEILDPTRDDALVVPLPEPLAREVAGETLSRNASYRFLFFVQELDLVFFTSNDKRVFWWQASDMRALAEGVVHWELRQTGARVDETARMPAEVTIAAYGRTFLRLGDGSALTLFVSEPEKGEKVTLVGKIFDAGGTVDWQCLERANGERIVLRDAPTPRQYSTEVTRVVVKLPKIKPSAKLTKAVSALREVGLLRELVPELLLRYADGGVTNAGEVFEAYFGDEERGDARAIAEGYLTHDWRFGQETSDVIAELCARVGGPPMFEQVSVHPNEIEVRVCYDGSNSIERVPAESLDAVVRFFNAALARTGDARQFFMHDGDDDQLTFVLTTANGAAAIRRGGYALSPL